MFIGIVTFFRVVYDCSNLINKDISILRETTGLMISNTYKDTKILDCFVFQSLIRISLDIY